MNKKLIVKNIIPTSLAYAHFRPPMLCCIGRIHKDINDVEWKAPVHHHNYTEILLCTMGEGTLLLDDQRMAVKKGDVFIYPKYFNHREFSLANKPMELYFMGIDAFTYPPLPENTLIEGNVNKPFPTNIYFSKLHFYLSELLQESSCHESMQGASLSALTNLIVAIVLQAESHYRDQRALKISYSVAIKSYIDLNYSRSINLKSIAEALYISESCVSHAFKQDYGISPIEYLLAKRMSVAQELLSSSNSTIAEIAQKVGYANPFYFSQFFKQRFGVPPTAFRQRNTSPPPPPV